MSAIDTTDAPIYAQLVEERGDVPTEVRETAEETQREVEQALRWGVTSSAPTGE
ncbi:hypothetical protein [Streptomyces sp. NPDC002851]